jgi:hypothetical protein
MDKNVSSSSSSPFFLILYLDNNNSVSLSGAPRSIRMFSSRCHWPLPNRPKKKETRVCLFWHFVSSSYRFSLSVCHFYFLFWQFQKWNYWRQPHWINIRGDGAGRDEEILNEFVTKTTTTATTTTIRRKERKAFSNHFGALRLIARLARSLYTVAPSIAVSSIYLCVLLLYISGVGGGEQVAWPSSATEPKGKEGRKK